MMFFFKKSSFDTSSKLCFPKMDHKKPTLRLTIASDATIFTSAYQRYLIVGGESPDADGEPILNRWYGKGQETACFEVS